MQFVSFAVLAKRIRAIKHMMKDREVSVFKKILIVAGIIYLILPVDLIPPILFPFGFIDDIILWLWILWYLKDTLDEYTERTGGNCAESTEGEDLRARYKDSDIVENVSYHVEENEEIDKNDR